MCTFPLTVAPSLMSGVTANLEFTPCQGPVILYVIFSQGKASTKISGPVMTLEGERDGKPCSGHPQVMLNAVRKLASLSKDHISAAELFRIVFRSASTIAACSENDASFVLPQLILE